MNFIPLLLRMKIWQLWLFSVGLSVFLTEIVVAGMGLLLTGSVPPDYLLTGLLVSLLVSSLIVAMLSYFLGKISESHQQLQTEIAAHQDALDCLEKFSSRIPGVVYQIKLSTDGRYSLPYSSQVLYDIFKIYPEQMREDATAIFSRIYPADYERVMSSLQRSAQNLSVWRCLFRVNFEDHSLHLLESNAAPERAKDGSTLWHGFISEVTHRTERKQHEQELTNNKRFTALIEAIPDAIFLKDAEGRWLITNEPAKRLFQLHDILWHEKTDMEIAALHPEFYSVHEKCLEDDEITWAAGQLTLFSETISIADNQNLHFEVCRVPIFDEQKQRQALVVIGRDVTEQKKITEQLNELALAVEQSPETIVITNLQGEIEYVNTAFTQSTGYSRMEAQGKDLHIFTSGKTPPEMYVAMWAALTQGQTWKGEFVNRRKDGSEYVEFAVIAPLRGEDGHINRYVAVKEDITEKKRLGMELDQHRYHLEELVNQRTQELMIAKAQADAANHAKSEFLANMSHEIRTPMNAILGFSDILTTLITDATQRYYLDAIHRSGKTLLRLINDILDLSKIEAGKLALQYTPVSLRDLLDDISIVFSQKAQNKRISFSVWIDEKLPANLLLDENRLRQILLNLVGNALKFTAYGFVNIKVWVDTNALDGKVDLKIEVSDSGVGIPKEQQEKIFAAFTQQDNQSVAYGGTGLGLTICKRLLELMHGNITVESEIDKGSCFIVTFNNVEIAGHGIAKKITSSVVSAQFQPARILVVDDIKLNRDLVISYLEEFSELTIFEAETGEQALKLLNQYPFDLILMDRRLPDISGDSVCQKIKSLPDCKNIPIVMITASVLTAQEQQEPLFYELKLNKPVNKTELLAAMQSFLPVDESGKTIYQPLVAKSVKSVEEAVNPEKLEELLALLTSDYQDRLNQLGNSSGFNTSVIVEIAEQLLEIAQQYHCSLLSVWANDLKTQAKLFDIKNLARTLKGFEVLLKQLNE